MSGTAHPYTLVPRIFISLRTFIFTFSLKNHELHVGRKEGHFLVGGKMVSIEENWKWKIRQSGNDLVQNWSIIKKSGISRFTVTATATGWALKATLALRPYLIFCASPSDF
jgi:hypothetical protein